MERAGSVLNASGRDGVREQRPNGEPLHFELPSLRNGGDNSWRRWIDTALNSPMDIVPWQTAPSIPGYTYRAEAHSVVVLFADSAGGQGE